MSMADDLIAALLTRFEYAKGHSVEGFNPTSVENRPYGQPTLYIFLQTPLLTTPVLKLSPQ